MSLNTTSLYLTALKSLLVVIPENNENSQNFVDPDKDKGLYLQPSPDVPERTDITGYSIVSANKDGRMVWQKIEVNNLKDFDISEPVSGECICFNGTEWTNTAILGSGINNLNGLTNVIQTLATGTTGNDFNIVSSGNTHTFNIPDASTTDRGLLTSADWDTFNNKSNGPGGASTQVQFNNGGSLDGSANLTFDTDTLSINDTLENILGNDINIQTQIDVTANNINILCGDSSGGDGSSCFISSGVGSTNGGGINITGGVGTTNNGGGINITGGDGNNDGGDIELTCGDGTTNNGGNIILSAGVGAILSGRIDIQSPMNVIKTLVTQITNINTNVTINAGAGIITTVSNPLLGNLGVGIFTVNNSIVRATDSVLCNIVNYSGTFITNGIPIVYVINVTNGSFDIVVINIGLLTLSAELQILFMIV